MEALGVGEKADIQKAEKTPVGKCRHRRGKLLAKHGMGERRVGLNCVNGKVSEKAGCGGCWTLAGMLATIF